MFLLIKVLSLGAMLTGECESEVALCFQCPTPAAIKKMYKSADVEHDFYSIRKAADLMPGDCKGAKNPLPYMKRAAEMGSAYDSERLGTHYLDNGQGEKAILWLTHASNLGSRAAKRILVDVLLKGDTEIEPSQSEAMILLEQLSWSGAPRYMAIFARELLKDDKKGTNKVQAVAWFKAALKLNPVWVDGADRALLAKAETELSASQKLDLIIIEDDIESGLADLK